MLPIPAIVLGVLWLGSKMVTIRVAGSLFCKSRGYRNGEGPLTPATAVHIALDSESPEGAFIANVIKVYPEKMPTYLLNTTMTLTVDTELKDLRSIIQAVIHLSHRTEQALKEAEVNRWPTVFIDRYNEDTVIVVAALARYLESFPSERIS